MYKRFSLILIVALLASLLGGVITSTPAQAASHLYVVPGGVGTADCTSWANACDLQTALANAVSGDEIWVQAGTYTPHISDRTATFTLKAEVAIYGGFTGGEDNITQRDPNPVTNGTVLSGDLKKDGNTPGLNSDNSYHVVTAAGDVDSSAILDGFTISGGNANGGYSYKGGGMINSGTPTLRNLILAQNFANEWGGGLYNTYLSGGPTLTNVTFSGNRALIYGGGMANLVSNPKLTNVTFSGNTADAWGGGMFSDSGTIALTNVTFSGNSADRGGGMANSSSSPTLLNVTFSENSASTDGGGMYLGGYSSPQLINTIIANSSSGGDCVKEATSVLDAFSSNNLIEDASKACGLTNGGSKANIIGMDPKLGPLENYGGYTQTLALLSGSPAIDKGANCASTDQRAVPRPQGNQCDIGAFESRPFTISGKAGAAGVTLSYVDGTPKTVTSQQDGYYSITIPEGWLGTVTPSHPCFSFTPPSISYNNVRENWINQNYTAGNCALTISGNAGVPSVTLSYSINGVAKTATSQSNNTYAFTVPWNWSGTVTPSHPCYTFNPASKNYTNVTANQTQNYAATLKGVSNCANINVKINGASVGTYGVISQGSLRMSYVGINNGTVNVTSTNDKNIIAAERVNAKDGTKITHFSELMGLPQNLVSTTYAFPAYDNLFFDSQLRIGNVSNATATVRLYIGTREMTTGCTLNSPYTLLPSASIRVSCPGVSGGPVRVLSNVNIIAAMRVLYNNGHAVTSFSELMGLPASQWNTTYWMPWYNNVDLNTQLRFGNVSSTTATVRLFIGGVEKTSGCTSNSPYTLAPYASLRVSCPGVNSGPVRLVSNVPIVASQRVAHFNGTKWNDFSELMALPASQLTATYLFPWYNNKDLDTQLRFGNVSTSTAHVNVFIGGVKMPGSPFTILPGASLRKSFAGINNGPVKIVSDVNIVASMRVLIDNGSAGLAFSELMGLPQSLLATSYVFPWYNNRDLDTQLRFGVP